jgi:DNA helicase-2/ATP-dependent DNA helicase PcrA
MANPTDLSPTANGLGFRGLPPGITQSQYEAVMAPDRILCVLAGAGTGKTGVLTFRVARRVDDASATAEHCLVCTFSRKAAEDLRDRLWRLGVAGVNAGTIHRLALGILRDWHEQRSRPAPTVLADRRPLLERVLAGHQAGSASAVALESEIGWAKAQMIRPEDYAVAAQQARRVVRVPLELTADLYRAYETERTRRSVLDLDDLLLESATALDEHSALADAQRWRYRHLFVDEMQDVNPAQFALLKALAGDDPDLFVVGDPNQSVYGWNGANPDLIGDLPRLFPLTRVIRLDDNHRSSPAIVRVASAALGDSASTPKSTRIEGPIPSVVTLDSDRDEATWVAREAWLAHRPGRRWSHIAVLARTNAQLVTIADALAEQRIPFLHAGRELGPASDLAGSTEGSRLAMRREDATDSAPVDGVVLSTFHRAKGLQWPCVFVIGLSEGLVPIRQARSEAALDEERRLLYVALTRAEDELRCSWTRASGAADGRTRRASRWLAAIEDTQAALEAEQAPAGPESVAHHLARLRALVSPVSAG